MPLRYPPVAFGDYETDHRAAALQVIGGQPRMIWSFTTSQEMIDNWPASISGGANAVTPLAFGPTASSGVVAGSWGGRATAAYVGDGTTAVPFYLAARIKLTTAMGTTSRCYAGAHNGDPLVGFGVGANTALVPSNFCYWSYNGGGNGSIDLGVPLDTNAHTIEAYRVNGLTYARIDGGPWLGGIAQHPDGATKLAYTAHNGADAVNRAIAVAFIALAWQVVP